MRATDRASTGKAGSGGEKNSSWLRLTFGAVVISLGRKGSATLLRVPVTHDAFVAADRTGHVSIARTGQPRPTAAARHGAAA